MARRNVIVGVDVGTSKVAVVVGQIDTEGHLGIIGLGESPAQGLRKGVIVDIEGTARSIEQAVEWAEQMSGAEINSAYVTISGPNLGSQVNRGVVAVSSHDKEISSEDVQRVLQAVRVVMLPSDRRIVHVLPRQFIVDGYDGIVDPIGMAGSRLEVEAVIVTAAGTSLQNLFKSVERAGLAIEETVLGPFASGEAVLQAAERDLGAVVADIGAGTTDIAIYEQGSLWFSSSIPVGGDYITSDLAVGLRTTISQAEKVKQESGCVLSALASDSDVVSITAVGEKGNRLVSRKTLGDIIQPRAEEILCLIKREIKRSGYRGMLPGGCVLTGGTASLDGLTELAREVLEMPVRVGVPENVGGLADVVSSPRFAACIGLLMYGTRNRHEFGDMDEHFHLGGMFSRLRAWFQDLFS